MGYRNESQLDEIRETVTNAIVLAIVLWILTKLFWLTCKLCQFFYIIGRCVFRYRVFVFAYSFLAFIISGFLFLTSPITFSCWAFFQVSFLVGFLTELWLYIQAPESNSTEYDYRYAGPVSILPLAISFVAILLWAPIDNPYSSKVQADVKMMTSHLPDSVKVRVTAISGWEDRLVASK